MNKLFLTFIVVAVGALVYFSIEFGKLFSETFNDITVGAGTLLAGMGGLVVFIQWSLNSINKDWFHQVKAAYPPTKLRKPGDLSSEGKTFILLRFPNRYGRIYIYDLSMKKRYWINNGPTLAELDYEHNSWIDINNEDDLNFKVFDKTWSDYKDYETGRAISVIDPYKDK